MKKTLFQSMKGTPLFNFINGLLCRSIVLPLIITLNLQAQQDDIDFILNNYWILTSLTINDEIQTPPSNDEVPFVELYFDPGNDDEPPFHFTIVCDEEIGSPTFGVSPDGVPYIRFVGEPDSFLNCQLDENILFNNIYFDFFGASMNDEFFYELIIENEFIHLELTSSNGDQAIYNSNVLHLQANQTINFKAYPNPVMDYLTLDIKNKSANYSVFIYNLKGVLIETRQAKDSIDVRSWAQGIYLIKIVDDIGNKSITKIIKL